jgi:hypothetical protein
MVVAVVSPAAFLIRAVRAELLLAVQQTLPGQPEDQVLRQIIMAPATMSEVELVALRLMVVELRVTRILYTPEPQVILPAVAVRAELHAALTCIVLREKLAEEAVAEQGTH